jgi:hypothetical protein
LIKLTYLEQQDNIIINNNRKRRINIKIKLPKNKFSSINFFLEKKTEAKSTFPAIGNVCCVYACDVI